MSLKNESKFCGNQAENLACVYLQQRGLKLVERNFICRAGEIDLIMKDGQELVFIEVRYRANNRFGHSVETITTHKRSKLLHTAYYYLRKNKLSDWVDYRFDVIAILGLLRVDHIQWIRNAF